MYNFGDSEAKSIARGRERLEHSSIHQELGCTTWPDLERLVLIHRHDVFCLWFLMGKTLSLSAYTISLPMIEQIITDHRWRFMRNRHVKCLVWKFYTKIKIACFFGYLGRRSEKARKSTNSNDGQRYCGWSARSSGGVCMEAYDWWFIQSRRHRMWYPIMRARGSCI